MFFDRGACFTRKGVPGRSAPPSTKRPQNSPGFEPQNPTRARREMSHFCRLGACRRGTLHSGFADPVCPQLSFYHPSPPPCCLRTINGQMAKAGNKRPLPLVSPPPRPACILAVDLRWRAPITGHQPQPSQGPKKPKSFRGLDGRTRRRGRRAKPDPTTTKNKARKIKNIWPTKETIPGPQATARTPQVEGKGGGGTSK